MYIITQWNTLLANIMLRYITVHRSDAREVTKHNTHSCPDWHRWANRVQRNETRLMMHWNEWMWPGLISAAYQYKTKTSLQNTHGSISQTAPGKRHFCMKKMNFLHCDAILEKKKYCQKKIGGQNICTQSSCFCNSGYKKKVVFPVIQYVHTLTVMRIQGEFIMKMEIKSKMSMNCFVFYIILQQIC